MKTECIDGKSAYSVFSKIKKDIYKGNNYFRGTEESIEKLLLNSNTTFISHSIIKKFIVRDGNDLVARFALILDKKQPEYIQVSFFEAQKNLGNLFSLIKQEIITHFPGCKKVVVGLNGHLNYSAGILLNRFDETPLFGLPYNPDYYADYFSDLKCRKMFTYRFSMEAYSAWAETYKVDRILNGLTVRFMDKKNIRKESGLYTWLNNKAFSQHPFWVDRDNEEDLELFYPFRFLLDNENLIFAEVNGRTIGFFLWYPDFNQLISSHRDLNIWDVLKFRLKSTIDTFRFTEIGIIPEYQKTPVALALINKSLPYLQQKGFKYCEGGFIFEENLASVTFTERILQRCYGYKPEPYRQFAVFETKLQ